MNGPYLKKVKKNQFNLIITVSLLVTMKIYAVSDGPPSLAVRMALKALNIPHEHISVDFGAGEHMTDEYAKVKIIVFEKKN